VKVFAAAEFIITDSVTSVLPSRADLSSGRVGHGLMSQPLNTWPRRCYRRLLGIGMPLAILLEGRWLIDPGQP
jgi:hypothetical protein